ncbi:RecQ family ATP-dependent DNA helicase [Perlabentimonas gracilis]|uniref:RecQ family ATP-dependent DNA helicase n=1 Tax=Perlabentimonas gracilis TaxID=2715279 RepID=UPI00140B9C9F|nr:ATP-dependent DNA helicase RecQ [Perlabentimonas gracilis]NHB69748.1 RecQ family ATP-dependent DNA helicase [Perlabentimonas gracilis]
MNQFEKILYQYWGFTSFRAVQQEIIESVYSGKDTLALMPTGGGKSITFQVPAMAKEGLCLVVTPLIALMKDQVENLKKRGIKAAALHSGMKRHELEVTLDNCAYGDYKFLYLSPERLGTDLFRMRLRKMNVNLVAIDESHCISQWGYDFRPSYLKIVELRELLPDVPFLAVTATATPEVVEDIQERLGFTQKHVVKMSFERKNLVYLVRNVEDKNKHLLKIVNGLPGTGVVYVRNRLKTKEIALMLQNEGITADYYHAGLSSEERNAKQDDWQHDRTRIIVSTNAFGMGIDKPDVRFVVHMDLPDSPEAYFQEAGRGGRDGKLAYAILLYNESDKAKVEQRTQTSFPEPEEIKRSYQALCSFLGVAIGAGKGEVYDFNLIEFATAYKFNFAHAFSSLKFLELEGYIELTDELDNPSRIMVTATKNELYKYQVAHAEMDHFIKVLLRNYAGLFNDYVKIDEKHLARISGKQLPEVTESLIKLSRAKIINYIPRKKTPLIIFTEERLDDKNLRISPENYNLRKERYTKRIEAMVNYASGTAKCRSMALLEYFGEKNATRCGKCDVCTSRNELDMSKYQFDQILEQIKTNILTEGKSLEALVDSIKSPPDKTTRVIRWLLDNKKIVKDSSELLFWNKTV